MLQAKWSAPKNIKTLVTTRLCGVSEAPYNSFNLGLNVNDSYLSVEYNREILSSYLPTTVLYLNQTHSNIVINYDTENTLNGDGIITQKVATACVILTADCLPIILTNTQGSFVAAIHAGWRGLLNNIIANTIAKIASHNILAYIGPAICQKHFEVKEDVYYQFSRYSQFFVRGLDNSFYGDLTAIAREQLLSLGLVYSNIFTSNYCTFCNRELFYSYRRDNITGRIATIIWRENG